MVPPQQHADARTLSKLMASTSIASLPIDAALLQVPSVSPMPLHSEMKYDSQNMKKLPVNPRP
jgi:hypothetical protein